MFFNRPTTGSFNTYGAGAWNETKEEEEIYLDAISAFYSVLNQNDWH